jgi:hypothetical protein
MIEIEIKGGKIKAISKGGIFNTKLIDGDITKFEARNIAPNNPFGDITIRVAEKPCVPSNGRHWSPDGGYLNVNDGIGIFDDGSKVDFNKGEIVRLTPELIRDDDGFIIC